MSTPNFIPGMKLKGIGRKRNKAQLLAKRDKKYEVAIAKATKKNREEKQHER